MDKGTILGFLSFAAVMAVGILIVRFYPEILEGIRYICRKLRDL